MIGSHIELLQSLVTIGSAKLTIWWFATNRLKNACRSCCLVGGIVLKLRWKTATSVIVAAILVALAGTATADTITTTTGTATTATQPVDTTTDPTATMVQTTTVPSEPVVPTTPAVLPVPTDPVQALLLTRLRTQIVQNRATTWRLQHLMSLKVSPGGNLWSLGGVKHANRVLQAWKSRSLQLRKAAKRQIELYRRQTDLMSHVMGLRPLRMLQSSGNLVQQLDQAKRQKAYVHQKYAHPPHLSQFLCIHSHEASWTDGGGPYYGGIQFGLNEWRRFGMPYTGKALAGEATPLEQIWSGERYWRLSGFHPWPNTARECGLIS